MRLFSRGFFILRKFYYVLHVGHLSVFYLCSEDEVGVLVDEGDDFVVVLGFLVVGAVALKDVAVCEG